MPRCARQRHSAGSQLRVRGGYRRCPEGDEDELARRLSREAPRSQADVEAVRVACDDDDGPLPQW
jgi:hypothetical protein